jgi:predicted PurR-regulated permease PerM
VVPVVGTFLVMAPVVCLLFLGDHAGAGLALLAWGVILVHPIDNLIRPLLISRATEVPFLVILFGVLGGVAAFGLVGVFVGPVTLSVATAIWREWTVAERCPPGSDPRSTPSG